MPPKKKPAFVRVAEEDEEDSSSDEDFEERTSRRSNSTPSRRQPSTSNPPKEKTSPVTDQTETVETLVWEHPELEYSAKEDLLNIRLPPKPQDFASDPSQSRLMIQKIVVEDFKSYRGVHTLGPFHKNLTMILGPNGSGKSNVIDALLFVFGFRSNKIRSKKLCSLIHTSSALGGQRSKFCRVEIFFYMIKDLDEDRYAIKPGTSFSVGRTAFLDNSSKYTLCGKNSSYKDVETLLKKAGIDLVHNRFLILQGEVEAIALMKPKATNPGEEGMLEYIEDIVGSNRFVPFIRKLEHRVATLEIACSRQSIKVREHEANKKELDPAVKHAQRFWNSQNEAAILKSKLYQCDRHRLNAERIPYEAEVKDKEAELIEMEKTKRQIMSDIKEIEAVETSNTEEQDKLHEEIESYQQQIRDSESAEMRRKSNLKKCNNELVRLTKDIDTEKKLLTDTEAIPDKARKQIEMLSQESKDLLEQEELALKTANDNLSKFDRKAREERAKKDAFYDEYSKKNALFNEAKSRVTVGENELQDLKEMSDRDRKKLEELRKMLSDAERKYDQDIKEYGELKKSLPGVERALRQTQVELPHARKKEETLKRKIGFLRERYEDETAGYQTLLRGSKVHNALLNAKNSGRLPGLLGRLGDLGAIDEIYDAAISTTCGQLDYYVVETAADGQRAIEYLIECSLPRCSFMCIDQTIETMRPMNKPASNFPAPRLFDLLRVREERIAKIFYQCLGDMLVVPTLVDAQAIDKESRGKWRIVTYEGSTIERTGAVSGGGRAITGRIGRDIRAPPSEAMQEEFRRTRAEHDSTVVEHQEMYVLMTQLEKELADLTAKVHGMTEARKNFEASLPAQTEGITMLKRSIVEQEKEVDKANVGSEEIDEKEKELVKLRADQDAAEADALVSKAKVDKSMEKIDAMFNELVQKFKDRAKTARERYENVEGEMAKEHASIGNAQHNAITIKKNMENLKNDLMKKRIEADALSTAEADGKEVFGFIDLTRNRRQKLSSVRQAAAELRKRRQKLEEEDREQGKKIMDQRDVVTTLNQTLDDIELNLENLSRQMALLKIRKVPNFRQFENVQVRPNIGWIAFDDDDDDNPNAQKQTDKDQNDDEVETDSEFDEIQILTEAEIEEISRTERDKMRMTLKAIETFLQENRENTDEQIFEEYAEKSQLYINEVKKLDVIGDKLIAHRKKLFELKAMRLEEFSEALAFLGATTQALYQLITNGGDASLKFVEEGRSADPFQAGVKFGVRPAKKSWKLIENLSGGEKTLASLCFVFAMHHYRSTPLYVMDEIDAALDSQNVRLIANYIKNSERTRNAQFIIISLRNQMFEVGNRMIGIYKTNDCTHHVVVSPKDTKNESKDISEIITKTTRQQEHEEEEALSSELSLQMGRVTIEPSSKPRKKLLVSRLEELESRAGPSNENTNGEDHARQGTSSSNGRGEEDANPFDFEDDDAPVRKRRRRTVCDEDEDEEEDDDGEDEDEEDKFESQPSTSMRHDNMDKNSRDGRRTTRSTCL